VHKKKKNILASGTNQNCTEIPHHPIRMTVTKKTNKFSRKDAGEMESLFTVGQKEN
jgi:hypothetical protein